jgi:hypothetical protein
VDFSIEIVSNSFRIRAARTRNNLFSIWIDNNADLLWQGLAVHISIAAHRHRGRCRRHRYSGFKHFSPVPEHSGTDWGTLIPIPDSPALDKIAQM